MNIELNASLISDRIIKATPADFQENAKNHVPVLTRAMVDYGLTDYAQMCYVYATALHESGMGKFMEEIWGPSKFQKGYEGNAGLGNTEPGDGYRYRGRGYVQVTGRNNYKYWAGRLNAPLLQEPHLAGKPEYASQIIVAGMAEGKFTGRCLSDYIDSANAKLGWLSARRVVNGTFKAEVFANAAIRYFDQA